MEKEQDRKIINYYPSNEEFEKMGFEEVGFVKEHERGYTDYGAVISWNSNTPLPIDTRLFIFIGTS